MVWQETGKRSRQCDINIVAPFGIDALSGHLERISLEMLCSGTQWENQRHGGGGGGGGVQAK